MLISILWTFILALLTSTNAQPHALTPLLPPGPYHPGPTSRAPHEPRASPCANALQNPSFETTHLAPWTLYATGSWASRAVISGNAHDGTHFFHARSNSSTTSTLTLAQSFSLPTGSGTVECGAWVWAGAKGRAKAQFEVFLDGVSCGAAVLGGGGGWVKVGKKVRVEAGGRHMLVVVGVVDAGGIVGRGIEVGVDGVRVSGVSLCLGFGEEALGTRDRVFVVSWNGSDTGAFAAGYCLGRGRHGCCGYQVHTGGGGFCCVDCCFSLGWSVRLPVY
ncbi:hypothetical protein BU23DRAFT_600975 [Bimuria novae-zelandiae CBS 107.79]|uniref:Concanavalin A-like lectin/glucanase n=1 Tax=Bimuria novae-zelandiae CBS 107.79 TaxID=1447943 RepID=A0A6A5V604_9PLEO|nr:hypothetical protein BU23DRAFT_600975 [Bimuria novae-zelandiae CBS 107.79]